MTAFTDFRSILLAVFTFSMIAQKSYASYNVPMVNGVYSETFYECVRKTKDFMVSHLTCFIHKLEDK